MALPPLPTHERTALDAFAQQLRAQFGPRLCDLRLFGSTVRGERWEESDIDVLVLIDQVTAEEKRAVWDAATLLNIDHDTMLSPLVLSPHDFQHLRDRERRLALDIDHEGISL